MSNISYSKYRLPDDIELNSITASYASLEEVSSSNIVSEHLTASNISSSNIESNFVYGTTVSGAQIQSPDGIFESLTVNGTASIYILNTVEQDSLKIGDKYITLLSGSNATEELDGAAILFGSGSEYTYGEQNSVAHIKYKNETYDGGLIEIYPNLSVTGEISGNGSGLYGIPETAVDLSNYARKDQQNTFTQKQTINNSLENGYLVTASGDYSHAEGLETIASGNFSHVEGYSVTTYGEYSHAEGYSTEAYETASHSEGWITKAKGIYSHAEGAGTDAIGEASHAEGYDTEARGIGSHAEGLQTIASGNYSHAEGYATIATSSYQHVQGQYNQTSSTALAIIGNGSGPLSRSNILEVYTGSVNILGQTVLSGGQKIKIQSKTSNYSLDPVSDYVIIFSGSNLTGTLPTAANNQGTMFVIKNKHTSSLFITSSGGLIDDQSNASINIQYHSYTVVSDGTGWNII